MEIEPPKPITASSEPARPYLPFLAAIEEGVVALDQLLARELSQPLGIILRNGHMPAVDEAGLILMGGELYAVDHVYLLHADSKEIHIGPANKGDVNAEGTILDSGRLVLTRVRDGLQTHLADAIGGNSAPWQESASRFGRVAMKQFGMESPRAEPDTVEDGIIVAKLWTP